jgi:hypothetical protein
LGGLHHLIASKVKQHCKCEQCNFFLFFSLEMRCFTLADSSSFIRRSVLPCSFWISFNKVYREGWLFPTRVLNRRCHPSTKLLVRGSPCSAAECWFHRSGRNVGLPMRRPARILRPRT